MILVSESSYTYFCILDKLDSQLLLDIIRYNLEQFLYLLLSNVYMFYLLCFFSICIEFTFVFTSFTHYSTSAYIIISLVRFYYLSRLTFIVTFQSICSQPC